MTLPDIDDINTLGGAKVNFAPVEDPTTDLDADQDNKVRANVAMLTHTSPRAWVRFTSAATTGAMVLVSHDSLWGSALGVAPTLARTSTGIFTITWTATQNDELGVAHALNFRAGWARYRGTTIYLPNVEPSAANVATVRIYNTSFALNDAAGVDFDVWMF